MKKIIYILKLFGAYTLGIITGSFFGCLNLGLVYLNDYLPCVILAPIVQLRALTYTWIEDDFLLEQISLGLGIALLMTSIILSWKKQQKNHAIWGVFGFTFLLSISTSLYVVSMIY